VGIGTPNPVGKLDVNGTIYQRGISLHADYVFEPTYELESIEDHAQFMWENKHLPAVDKAQIDENGLEIVEVGVRSRGVLEELEKAHIYIEQLKKEKDAGIQSLRQANETLREETDRAIHALRVEKDAQLAELILRIEALER